MQFRWLWLVLLGACAAPQTSAPPSAPTRDFNALLLQVADAEDGFLTLKGVRTAAIMHVAMLDAWRGASGLPARVACTRSANTADPLVAAEAAAVAVASTYYPTAASQFAALPKNHTDTDSAQLGRRCAKAIMMERSGDNWNRDVAYAWQPEAPGVYADFHAHSGTPAGFVFGRGWAEVTPFVLRTIPRVAPPPPVDSPAYAAAWDEVRRLGARVSVARGKDQTHLALWWKDFAERSFNRLARQLAATENLEPEAEMVLFARLNVALFDSYIAAFNNKYHYNHWRPYTAIRAAATDGNPATEVDPDWDNLHSHTYAFPSYPSAHGTVCAAAATALAATFGDDYAFRMRTAVVDSAGPMSEPLAMHPSYRDFASPLAAAHECGLSRIYLGIHFRYDSEVGVELGQRVGSQVVAAL